MSRRDIPYVANGQRALVDQPKLPSQYVLSRAVAVPQVGIAGSPDRSGVGSDNGGTFCLEAPGDVFGNGL